MTKGKLYLIPTTIADDTQSAVIPTNVRQTLPGIRFFLAENIRTARRYLSSLKVYDSIESLKFEVLDKDTNPESLKEIFAPLFEGEAVGILSESGCPGIADPGALAVAFAHRHDIEVVPLVGPSSITLALMASGLNGQRFSFQGYLPIDSKELSETLKELERESKQKQMTQIFIETPYRNNSMMHALLRGLKENTLLCVALDLTAPGQMIKTLPIKQWKLANPEFPKRPAVFLFLAS